MKRKYKIDENGVISYEENGVLSGLFSEFR
jgi:hypothetical protein